MQDFSPQHIFIHPEVEHLPVTSRILRKFPHIKVQPVHHVSEIKTPQQHTRAKKQLFLSKSQGQALKTCQGMGDYVCCQYHTIALVTDCHLECSYCILQDYLKNNPVITVYANVDEILDQVSLRLSCHPDKVLRVGTGELSDSLALDHITEFSTEIVSFANRHKNVVMELKTKTANIGNLLRLKHSGNVVVSWSVNPQNYIQMEEHKCDSLTDRLDAARACADYGYPVGFHLDPLLYLKNWQEEYENLITQIAGRFHAEEISWVSVGSLRFTPELKKITGERFPKSKIMAAELFPSPDGKTRYFRPLRQEMYTFVTRQIQTKLKTVPHYLCMETRPVWQNVFGSLPKNNAELEQHLARRFAV